VAARLVASQEALSSMELVSYNICLLSMCAAYSARLILLPLIIIIMSDDE
jgi:hypothetical protein